MLALRTGQPLGPQLLVEEAEKQVVPEAHQGILDAMKRLWVIGDPAAARAEIDELAASYGVDEVMVHPVAGAFTGTDRDRSPGREGDAAAARRLSPGLPGAIRGFRAGRN
jgi:alkanesulfonate monooxygenase SsuD/methylene tetrahydromethanopterin reductase-like flavin-dependent oxidoreductase (luciferase family)